MSAGLIAWDSYGWEGSKKKCVVGPGLHEIWVFNLLITQIISVPGCIKGIIIIWHILVTDGSILNYSRYSELSGLLLHKEEDGNWHEIMVDFGVVKKQDSTNKHVNHLPYWKWQKLYPADSPLLLSFEPRLECICFMDRAIPYVYIIVLIFRSTNLTLHLGVGPAFHICEKSAHPDYGTLFDAHNSGLEPKSIWT